MTRLSILVVLSVACAGLGCKGETVVKPDPQTKTDLDNCKNHAAEQDKRIAALTDENAELMRKQGSGATITVAIEGNTLTVKPYTGPAAPPIDNAAAAAGAKEFINVVQRSRGSIQKCYEQALKKNTGLQARTISLTVSASFSSSGAYKDSSFSPSLGDTFDNCIKTVASHWNLGANPPANQFQATVSLTPS
ncbi:MAG TPA: hypothetical protein VGF94_08780 [Kofleriaceae bacterium]|jgi:hypothetical protein